MKNLLYPMIFGASVTSCQMEQKQPNILLILTDDQGWGDVGIHGNPLIAFPIDGVDLKDLIKGKTEQLPDRMIFTYVWGGRLAPFVGSVRTREYRLSVFQDRAELYHINHDPGEMNNLYDQETQRAKSLHDAYMKWYDRKVNMR